MKKLDKCGALSKFLRFIKNITISIFRFFIIGYRSLPWSNETKRAHKQLLLKYFPSIISIIPRNYDVVKMPIVALPFEINTVDDPMVSIIIPIYGKIDYTLMCLASIAENQPNVTIEVILIDDCSPDDSVQKLQQVKGIRLFKNENNIGYLHSCNFAASKAKGKYLHFLNNDTLVKPHWLDELINTYHAFSDTGLVGSKFLNPDGSLQEAGSNVAPDGTTSAFGYGDNPSKKIYNVIRQADYCSAASILIKKEIFESIGGFSECYAPAYYDDVDLAYKVRDFGLKVYYQPKSVVVHFQSQTYGEYDNLKNLHNRNKVIFAKQWMHHLNNEK